MHRNIVFVTSDPVLRSLLAREYTVTSSFDELQDKMMAVIVDNKRVRVRELKRNIIVLASHPEDVKFTQTLSEVRVSDHTLRTIIATGNIHEGKPVLSSNGINVCTVIDDVVLCACKVPLLYLLSDKDLVLRELSLLYSYLSTSICACRRRDVDSVVKALRDIVISERKRHKLSRTLTLLTELSLGKIEVLDKIPTHVLDVLSEAGIVDLTSKSVDVDTLRAILKKLERQIYVK